MLALPHRDDQRVIDEQTKLFTTLAAGVKVAIREGQNIDAHLAYIVERRVVARQALYEIRLVLEHGDRIH